MIDTLKATPAQILADLDSLPDLLAMLGRADADINGADLAGDVIALMNAAREHAESGDVPAALACIGTLYPLIDALVLA